MTTRIVAQVGLREGSTEEEKSEIARVLCGAAGAFDGLLASHAGVHGELSIGGGDLTWDLLMADDAAVDGICDRVKGVGPTGFMDALGGELGALGPRVASVEAAIPEPLDERIDSPGLVGIKRTLWLRVLPQAAPSAREAFEHETPLLARAVPAIRNWSWSRVKTLAPNPMQTRWTHLWEQEFESFAGLEVDYMSSPCHWGYIDRWFDPEMPDQIVDVWLAHLSCPETAPVLSWQHDR